MYVSKTIANILARRLFVAKMSDCVTFWRFYDSTLCQCWSVTPSNCLPSFPAYSSCHVVKRKPVTWQTNPCSIGFLRKNEPLVKFYAFRIGSKTSSCVQCSIYRPLAFIILLLFELHCAMAYYCTVCLLGWSETLFNFDLRQRSNSLS